MIKLIALWATILTLPLCAMAQDTLVLKNGKRIAFMRMKQYSDGIEFKLANDDTELVLFQPDEILGYWNNSLEISKFLIFDPDQEGLYYFAEREAVGAITIFTSKELGIKMYALKGNSMVKVWDSGDSRELMDQREASFEVLVKDDPISKGYVQENGYKHKSNEIIKVVNGYNIRNFVEPTTEMSKVTGKVFLYRTRFQKTQEVIRINNQGKLSELHIEDFIVIEVPILQPLKLRFFDTEHRTEQLVTGEMAQQFYEVIYDKQTNGFVLDKKSGTELHYEFYKIKDKVNKKMTD